MVDMKVLVVNDLSSQEIEKLRLAGQDLAVQVSDLFSGHGQGTCLYAMAIIVAHLIAHSRGEPIKDVFDVLVAGELKLGDLSDISETKGNA